jgi:predicted nucleotidyltransferase
MEDNIIAEIINTASKDECIKKLYLFGSHARGSANVFSDVDIAVIHTEGVNRAALNEATEKLTADVEYTYIAANIFETDNHPLHVTSSIKKEGVLLWQR